MPVLSNHNDQQCSASATQVTHVIFDVDGTLLDTGPLYNKAITKVDINSTEKQLFAHFVYFVCNLD